MEVGLMTALYQENNLTGLFDPGLVCHQAISTFHLRPYNITYMYAKAFHSKSAGDWEQLQFVNPIDVLNKYKYMAYGC